MQHQVETPPAFTHPFKPKKHQMSSMTRGLQTLLDGCLCPAGTILLAWSKGSNPVDARTPSVSSRDADEYASGGVACGSGATSDGCNNTPGMGPATSERCHCADLGCMWPSSRSDVVVAAVAAAGEEAAPVPCPLVSPRHSTGAESPAGYKADGA